MSKSNKNEEVVGMVTIKMTNKHFVNKFAGAFSELSALPSNPKTGRLKYAIKRTLGSVQDAMERYNKQRQEIFEERAKMDENGNPQFDKDKNYLFESKDLRKEAFSKLDELNEKEIQLTVYPIRAENIVSGNSSLSIAMEINLEGLLIPSEEEQILLEELNK